MRIGTKTSAVLNIECKSEDGFTLNYEVVAKYQYDEFWDTYYWNYKLYLREELIEEGEEYKFLSDVLDSANFYAKRNFEFRYLESNRNYKRLFKAIYGGK